MDPSASYLSKMLSEEITPVVMVLRTPLVEESCHKNSLNFVHMLRPFCIFNNIDVPVRTASDQPYRLHKFNLRLHYASDVRQPNVEDAEECLKQVVTQASEDDANDLLSDPPQLESKLNTSGSESLPSWFKKFNKELINTSAFSEHEAFDHPVACLLVVSSKDEQPVNKFVDLFNTNQLPSLLNDGAMDPKILKYYLLIHDNQDGTADKAIDILTEMKGTFGSNDCGLLCINSAQGEFGGSHDNPWVPCKTDALLDKDLGCLLNGDDVNEMKDLMQNLASKHIIPHMEQKIRALNQQVSATRKGFRNQIKNLWWRKGKEDAPDASNNTMYTFSSIESQIRILGDYAFMLRDYELALSNYRLLSTDYKLDKAWKRYAGVQDFTWPCGARVSIDFQEETGNDGTYIFHVGSVKKGRRVLHGKCFNYITLGSSGRRNVTRCGLWWTEMLKTRDQYNEAAGVYFRISNEEPSLHAAVMLEQASYCYLLTEPHMMHKYGFHLVLAGSRYYISEQRKHAIRAYRNALSVYKGNEWNYINDHVHFNIGKWYALLGIFDIAIKYMLEVLACGHQSIATQELFLRDFLQIVQKLGKPFEVFRLQLPVINMPSLKVIFEDHRTYASPAAVMVRESLWQTLEEDLVPSIPTTRTNWLESQPKLSKKFNDSNICIAGEAIKVVVEFRNPLKIPVSVSGVSLVCQISEKSETMESETSDQKVNEAVGHLSTVELHNDLNFEKLKSSWELNAGSSSFEASEVDFSLGGCETAKVELVVTPKLESIINIMGVRWKLSDSVVGYSTFDFNLVKKRNVNGRRRVRQSPSTNLKFTVIKSVPKLEGCIHHLPNEAYAGELKRLVLELKNPSEFPVKNLKMKINHPRFLNPGNLEDLKTDFPTCLEKQINSECTNGKADNVQGSNGLLFSFPEDVRVQGGTTFSWPLWLHAGIPGSISLYISIYYELETLPSEIRFRTLRMHYNLEVLPSLEISFRISRCPSSLREFLVRMDIMNGTSSESFQLHQLSSIGHQWEVSSLPPDGTISPSNLLIAGQALSCFFKIENCSKSTREGAPSSLSTLSGHDVRLGSQGNNKILFDISRKPLADFHHYERLHQNKSIEATSSTVDFIIISQPQENMDGPSDTTRLFSHHLCHCSVASTSPVWWLMDGPRAVYHDFSTSFCEIKLCMVIHNSSSNIASVRLDAHDPSSSPGHLSGVAVSPKSSVASANQEGWHDVSQLTEIRVTTDALGAQTGKSSPPDSITPFIWSGSTSASVELGPMCSTEVPLQICLFAPGTYNLSNYNLRWVLQLSADDLTKDGAKQISGSSQGNPYYLTVLQAP